MDFYLASILVVAGVVVSLGIGWGVYEYNSRKTNRGRWKTPDEQRKERED